MKLLLVSIGKLRGLYADPVAEYEKRLRRYYPFEVAELKEHPSHQAAGPEEVMEAEGRRILARVPDDFELIALHRTGQRWSSEALSSYVSELGLQARPGAAFVIGGAFGLSDEVLDRARRLLSLSTFTLPHEMARLLLTEQLYRAGTIARGEPYHK